MTEIERQLSAKFKSGSATCGVVGLGYVGLPLAVEIAKRGHSVVGVDLDPRVVSEVNGGRSHIQDTPTETVAALVGAKKLRATTQASDLGACDAISICVPTPLNKTKDPELSYVVAA